MRIRSAAVALATGMVVTVGLGGVADAATVTPHTYTWKCGSDLCTYPSVPYPEMYKAPNPNDFYYYIGSETVVRIACWEYSYTMNGDNVWYYGEANGPYGWADGEELLTGHDPNPAVPKCGGCTGCSVSAARPEHDTGPADPVRLTAQRYRLPSRR